MKKYFFLLGVCIVLGSCSTGDATAVSKVLGGGSSQAVTFLNCRAVSEDEIEFEFSKAVTVQSLSLDPELPIASVEDGSIVKVKLGENVASGLLVNVDMLAEDADKNSINVLTSFRSRNSQMPKLVINEVCTEATSPKTEFIEFKMKTAGNLGGLRIFIMGNTNATKQTIYEFSSVNVKKDDYVLLHLRTRLESYKDEYNGNKEESSGDNSSLSAWDFYVPGNDKLIHDTASAVYVLDQDDNVLDAVMISKDPSTWWDKDYFAEAADFLFQQGAWKSPEGEICSPTDAVRSAGTTNTRTICRDETVEDSNTAADWYIVYTSNATPGKPNNSRRWN